MPNSRKFSLSLFPRGCFAYPTYPEFGPLPVTWSLSPQNPNTMLYSIVLSSQADQGIRSARCYAKSIRPGHRPVGSCLVLALHSLRELLGLPTPIDISKRAISGRDSWMLSDKRHRCITYPYLYPNDARYASTPGHMSALGKHPERICAMCLAINPHTRRVGIPSTQHVLVSTSPWHTSMLSIC